MPPDQATTITAPVKVWDAFVRLFHWLLVACVVLDLWVLDDGGMPHEWVGHVATALVLARIAWGFVGSRHARFTDFWPTPTRLRAHLAELRQARISGHYPAHVGHNPLGALMMLALMGLVLLLGLTGWLQTTDMFFGLAWLQEGHEWLANGLLLAAGLHAAAALLMGRLERVNLVRAMLTGVKRPV